MGEPIGKLRAVLLSPEGETYVKITHVALTSAGAVQLQADELDGTPWTIEIKGADSEGRGLADVLQALAENVRRYT